MLYLTIIVWDVNTDDCLQTLNGHSEPNYSHYSSESRCIEVLSEERISSSYNEDNAVKIWRLKTNNCIWALNGHSDTVANIQVISETNIASSSCNGNVKFGI